MRRILLCAFGWMALAIGSTAFGQVPAAPPFDGPGPFGPMRVMDPRIAEFANLTRGAKVYDGMFKLYQKDENVYMEIPQHHLGKPVLCPIAVARGAGMGGMTLNFDEQWVLLFKKAGDKIHLIRRNVHHKAKPGSPTARAVDVTYTDSVLMAL